MMNQLTLLESMIGGDMDSINMINGPLQMTKTSSCHEISFFTNRENGVTSVA